MSPRSQIHAQAFRMILPGFLQSRYLSLRTECTRGLEKLEGADLVVLLVRNKARHRYWSGTGLGHFCIQWRLLKGQGILVHHHQGIKCRILLQPLVLRMSREPGLSLPCAPDG